MSFNELLDETSIPAASAFTVKRTPQGGSEQTVSLTGSPEIRGGSVILTLANDLVASDTGVKVSYAVPSSGAKLQDQAGNDAAGVTDKAVDAADTTPPRLERGEIESDVLTIFFSEALNENSVSSWVGDYFRFNLTYFHKFAQDGQCPFVNRSQTARPREIRVRGNTVEVVGLDNYPRLRASVDWTSALFSYFADVSVDKRLKDLAGNTVALTPESNGYSWTRIIYLDNVTVLPYPKSATVNGKRLTMTFSSPLKGDSVPAAGAFTVKVNNAAVSLAGSNPVAVSGNTVTLNLAEPVRADNSVKVSYAKPASGALQNVVCEVAPSFTGQSVTNSTP
jgi:uncharacterized repeat protein (TIGR02059 family)